MNFSKIAGEKTQKWNRRLQENSLIFSNGLAETKLALSQRQLSEKTGHSLGTVNRA